MTVLRFLAALLLTIALGAQAEDYPSKSVRLIAAAGAGGVVAAELVARASPDGHVLMLGDSGAMAINPALNPKLTYAPLRDFALITALAAVPTVLVAPAALPPTSLTEFVA